MVPPSMISAASPFADPIICAIESPLVSSVARPAQGAFAGVIQFRFREQQVQIQAFCRDVGVSDEVRLAPVHGDHRNQVSAGDTEVKRVKF